MPQTFSLHLHYVATLSWESQKSKNVVVQTADIDWLTNILKFVRRRLKSFNLVYEKSFRYCAYS